MATPLKGKSHNVNPPYPPLTGGKKKQKPLDLGERIAFLYPPVKGG